jgi:2-polyprenyl-6-methoxyphenol hydroxylase-like FAD-dependent oxidoreductase
MSEERPLSDNVIIVGGGPVGLLLGSELALAGIPVVLLERREETDPRSPGMAINGAVVELLDQRGLLDEIRGQALELPAAHFANLWLDLSILTGRHETSLIIPQRRLEKALEERALTLGVEIRRGVEVTGIEQDADGVAALTTAGRVTGAHLVGADGWDSTVRRLAGIGFPLRGDAFYGIIGDIEADWADLLPEQVGASYCPVGGTYAGTPTEPGVCRISTAEWGVAPADPNAPVTIEELNERVLRLTGTEFKDARPRWLARVGNPTANADAYRSGRVFLAGDAAHVFFPFNGQRISTGLQDAVNLGWKLAADLRGTAPEGLLDTYQSERRPAVEWAIANVAAQEALVYPPRFATPLRELFTRLIALGDANRLLAEAAMGLDIRYPLGEGPLTGARLPHVPLTGPNGDTTVPALLRPGLGVLLDLSGSGTGTPQGYTDRIVAARADPTPQIPAAAVLLRPDGHVAWEGSPTEDADGLAGALLAWFGEPVAANPRPERGRP